MEHLKLAFWSRGLLEARTRPGPQAELGRQMRIDFSNGPGRAKKKWISKRPGWATKKRKTKYIAQKSGLKNLLLIIIIIIIITIINTKYVSQSSASLIFS